ncbi:hypothetical protein KPL70_021879 [Citrus sinensis]|nr:hypothetical protein KPL70_021879 [Citrus sinensis]
MSNMQPDGDQSCFKELYAILVRLESKFIDIKQQLQPVLPLHNFSFSVWMGELKNKCSLRLQRDNMVSLQDDVMEELLDQLVEGPSQLSVVAIIDSCGFGSTDFAAQAYNSNYVKSYFDCRAWVSFDINRGTMLDNILKFVMPQPALREIMHKDFEQRKMALHDYLRNKRYLIVVDDVIASDVWDYIGKALPDHQNGSRVLVMLSNDKIFSLCRLENGEMIHLDSVPARPLRATLHTLDMPASYIHHTPDGIWKMYKLRHLNFGSVTLPAHPGKFCSSLENLNFISVLHPSSCTQDILGRLPSLQTLRVHENLSSYQFMLSNSLCALLRVESLKLVDDRTIVSQPSSMVPPEYQFPPRLVELSLSILI